MMTFQNEPYDSCIDEILGYLKGHGEEVENMGIDPLLEVYQDGADNGTLHIFTMRDEDELVGYAAFWIVIHPHHADKVFAMNDLVYVRDDHRGAEAVKFFQYVDKQLDKCHAVTYTLKNEHDHPELMEHLGYRHTEKVYTKVNR